LGYSYVAKQTNINESNVRRWKKIGIKRKAGSGRKAFYPEIEVQVYQKFLDLRRDGKQVSNQILKKIYGDIAKKNDNELIVGRGLIAGFKKRYSIVYRKRTRASQKIRGEETEHILKFQQDISLLLMKHSYKADAIINANETAVYLDMPMPQTLELKGTNYY
jgi:hypothetical protein